MRAAREGIHRVASGTAPVLILGETGTGKELAARAIHRLSRRKGRFCATNAAELQAGLAASELFGRVKGAYTDAEASEGLVGAAEDGTLFLDEMGDLPKDVQPALLRLLESGHYRPVGSDAEVLGRARVVAATNVDLEAAVRAGRFRRDLLGRLRGYVEPITLPPLRQRPEDLVTWAQRFGGPEALREWSARDVERLLLHPWLEGLRELRRVCAGGPAALDSLPSGASSPSGEELTPEPSDAAAAGPLPDRAALIRALQETSGNVLAASRALHIHRRRLYRLIEEEGLDLQDFRAPEK
ncbi:MAG: sigma 54-interacting transcriptional regulator [Myxococcota bacterium]